MLHSDRRDSSKNAKLDTLALKSLDEIAEAVAGTEYEYDYHFTRGVIDIETLEKTQQDLVETLQETLKIQQEGRTKRHEAERELSAMEGELRTQLLELQKEESKLYN